MIHKTIFHFFLVITTSALYGMDLKKTIPECVPAPKMKSVFRNNDLLSCVTEQVCVVNNWQPGDIRKNIDELALVDRYFYSYFSPYYNNDNCTKNIIRKIALQSGLYDQDVAIGFGKEEIAQEISRLFDIATTKKKFTSNDLKDVWFLNATGWCTCDLPRHSTLLLATLKTYDVYNAKKLLRAGINLTIAGNRNPIQFMAAIDYSLLKREDKENFLAIVRLLLKKGIDPDSRFDVTCPTLLHRAVKNNNRRFARSLLKAGADPYKLLITPPLCLIEIVSIDKQLKQYDPKNPWARNAFYINRKYADWLQGVIDQVETERNSSVLKREKKKPTQKKSHK